VNLERERLAQEIARRKEESDRDERREKSFLDVLVNMQQQMFTFLSKQQLTKASIDTPVMSSTPPPTSLSLDDHLENDINNDINDADKD